MKRKDLVVGAELYHAKPYDWKHNHLTGLPGQRVRILAVEPHRTPMYGSGAPIKTTTGNGVLVEVLNEKTGEPHQYKWGTATVVQLAHLRGNYATTRAEVDARRAAAQDAARDLTEQRRAVIAKVQEVMDRARIGGVHSVTTDTPWTAHRVEDARVSIGLADFERMLEQLDRLRALEH